MDYLATRPQFNNLSLADLLEARDLFHPHLMHKANVIGTAIGRYLIRKTDSYPEPNKEENKRITKAQRRLAARSKPPRTLQNSEVRDYSWPCVLVFVSKWEKDSDFDNNKNRINDYIPKTIYMPDGRSVPVCVVYAPLEETAPPPMDPKKLEFPKNYLSGGYPVATEAQGVEHFASLGCLVSDGHTVYALTNRHVTGDAGEKLYTYLDGKKFDIGVSSAKQIEKLPFIDLYKTWAGKDVYVNMDIGLIKLDDLRVWNPTIFGLGEIGPLADLSVYNLTLNLIGCPVQAFGCASGKLFGQISALFYRYKSIGGFEYVSDFLIGGRGDAPLQTRPGDSGTVWAMESDDTKLALQPVAIQWGGTVFSDEAARFPFALATNLSNVCRELNVDLFRSTRLASFDYWGAVGHYAIGSFACEVIENAKLKKLMKANQELISFATGDIDRDVNKVKAPGFVQLADVPDKVWKNDPRTTTYGRKGAENPNHYADIDYGQDLVNGHNIPVNSLDARTPTPNDLTTHNWRDYYDRLKWNKDSMRGCLPFRVWQIYKAMVGFLQNRELPKFVAAAGILAHYVGDACQPLHGSYLDDGDPWRNPDGTPAVKLLGHSKGFGAGVHHAYEASMIDQNVGEIVASLNSLINTTHNMQLVQGGQEAGFAMIELMRRARATINPIDIVERYMEIKAEGKSRQTSKLLWADFENGTKNVIKDGCRTMAMIWDSAWAEGGGDQLPNSSLVEMSQTKLQEIYEDRNFIPSVILNEIDQYL